MCQRKGRTYQLALLIERLRLLLQRLQLDSQRVHILHSPALLDCTLQHERMRCALSESKELNHEHAVVAISQSFLEIDIEVSAETVLGLADFSWISPFLQRALALTKYKKLCRMGILGRTHNSVNDSLLGREVHVLNAWVRSRQRDDRAVENRCRHSTSHHRVAEQSLNTSVVREIMRVTEILLEGLPIYAVICLEESEVGKESIFVTVRFEYREIRRT